jgi:hypothetical protein
LTKDEWKNNREFDRMKNEMNGIFTEWPTPSEITEGSQPRSEAEKKERMRIWNSPGTK